MFCVPLLFQGVITYMLKTNYQMYNGGDVLKALGFHVSQDVKNEIRDVRVCKDRVSAAMDVPQHLENKLLVRAKSQFWILIFLSWILF